MVNDMSPKEKKLASIFDKVGHFVISFHFYFYLLISTLILAANYLNFNKLFNILFIIMIVVYFIELFLGFDRNFLGYVGTCIAGFIGYLFTKTTEDLVV